MTSDSRPGGIEGILNGLTGLLGSLGDLAERGEQLRQNGGFQTPDGRQGRYQIGFNIRTAGNGRDGYEVRPFGDVKQDDATGRPTVLEVREPSIDVFEEEDMLLVIAEMPGVPEDALRCTLDADLLTLEAEHGTKRYRGEVRLPETPDPESMRTSANNGVFEVVFDRSN